MGDVEFELVRQVEAPVQEVFARLADIERYHDWMPHTGSILRTTRQTSAGPLGLGTTYLDRTRYGAAPGEVVEFDPPHRLTFHWWARARSGSTRLEGWPGYALKPIDDQRTLVRHHVTLRPHGLYRLATPVLQRLALKERTATVDALQASFGRPG